MRTPGESAKRVLPVGAGADPVALREKLVRLRGVREAVVVPEEGIARLRCILNRSTSGRRRKLSEEKIKWHRSTKSFW
jgi:hypothetical protein